MLRGIHKASASWLGKAVMAVVMGTLVVSFAIWGIGDIFRGFGQSTVAKVGGTEITIPQFRAYYTDRMTQLSRRFGRPVTPDQARALGLDRQLVGQYVAETTLDEKAQSMQLGISDAEVSRRVMSDPVFAGLNGQFDRSRFEQTIRAAGMNEASYVTEQRRLTIRRQIALSVSGDIVPPNAALDAIYQFRNEKRSADIVALGASLVGDIAAPDAETLKKYFDERKILFRAPETRKVTLLALTPADQARWMTVSDDDAKAEYEKNKATYGTPEKRELKQIVFKSMDEARAAADKIKGGLSFEDLAKERGLKDGDTDLGTVAKADIIDPAVGDAAFALSLNAVSEPVQGRFGVVLVKATKIEAGTQKTYEQVAATIKATLAELRARDAIGNLRDKIEDERAGGSTLAESAKKLGLTARVIEAVDRSGRDAAGQPVADLPKGVDIVQPIFATDVGVEADPLQLAGGGYLWFDVTGVTPSRDRSLDEVKAEVETRWRNDEIGTRLDKLADDIVAKVRAGTPLAQAVADKNLKVESVSGLQRGQPNDKVAAKVAEGIFGTGKGGAGTAEGSGPTDRVVYVVTGVEDSKPDRSAGDVKAVIDALKNGYGEDIVNQYVAQLEKDIGVSINEQALAQITGAATN